MDLSRPFACPFCAQSFTRSENLKRHKRTRHGASGYKTFECQLCHASFGRRDICKRHQERCDGNPTPRRTKMNESGVPSETLPLPPQKAAAVAAAAATRPPDDGLDYLLDAARSLDVPPPENMQVEPPRRILSAEATAACVASYFAHFHPSFPILHRPTFSPDLAPKPLVHIVAAIGNLYRCKTDPAVAGDVAQQQSNSLWESSVLNLKNTSISDPGRWKDVWILQTALLCIVYGAFATERFSHSRQMLTRLVSDIREGGLFQQHSCEYSYSWRQELDARIELGVATQLEDTWRSFIDEESLKMSLYGLTMIDFQLVLACNARPEISALELVWDLPWSTQAWEAGTAQEWAQQIHLEAASYQAATGPVLNDRGPALKSLFLVTQTLMAGGPPDAVLKALAYSHFSLLCVAVNIYRIVRGFTHYLYQLPPNPSNPSPFHILTQSQNSQIFTALAALLGLKTASLAQAAGAGSATGSTGSTGSAAAALTGKRLWSATQLVCWVAKISLCVPDDFLICGIVDTDITASFATAAHLSLGTQILGRRSRNYTATPKPFGEEGFLLIFDELMNTLDSVWGEDDALLAMADAPWVSVIGFRALLDMYRVLRLATTDLNERMAAAAAVSVSPVAPRAFDAARVVYDTVNNALTQYIRNKRASLPTRNLEQLGMLELTEDPKLCERKYMMIMVQSCNERDVWPVIRSVGIVLEEIFTGSL